MQIILNKNLNVIALNEFKKILPLLWIIIAAFTLTGDYLVGPYIQSSILFLLPVTLASWYNGKKWGLLFAVVMPLIRCYYSLSWNASDTLYTPLINALIRIAVLSLFAFFLDRTAIEKKLLLKDLLILKGMLSTCCVCKKIQEGENTWDSFEKYIEEHSYAQFTHTICPQCAQTYYGYNIKERKFDKKTEKLPPIHTKLKKHSNPAHVKI